MQRVSSTRGVSFSLAGWLWADLLLGLFTIFLAASAVASASAPRPSGIDPHPLEFKIAIDGTALLSTDPARILAEQQKIANDVRVRVSTDAPGRHAAIVFVYGSHERAADGDKIAALAAQTLTDGQFSGAVMKPYHELVAGDQGGTISFEIYFDE